jgi:hypothetical protein
VIKWVGPAGRGISWVPTLQRPMGPAGRQFCCVGFVGATYGGATAGGPNKLTVFVGFLGPEVLALMDWGLWAGGASGTCPLC